MEESKIFYEDVTPKPRHKPTLQEKMIKEMRGYAKQVLGDEFDEHGQARWKMENNSLSINGQGVRSLVKPDDYFVFDYGVKGETGLKRVTFDDVNSPDRRVLWMSSQALRKAGEEYRWRRRKESDIEAEAQVQPHTPRLRRIGSLIFDVLERLGSD